MKLFLALVGFSLLQLPSYAALVTVTQSGTGDFATIAAAVAGTSDGDNIVVIDGGSYPEPFEVNNRTIKSEPPGAVIIGTVTVTGATGSITSFTGFTFQGSTDAIRFYGDGPDYSPAIGTLNINACTFTDIIDHGILLNFSNNGVLNIAGSSFTNCGQNGLTLLRNCSVGITNSQFSANGLGGNGNGGIFVDGDNNNALGRVLDLTNVILTGNLNGIKSWRQVKLTATNLTVTANLLDGISIDGQGTGSIISIASSTIASNNNIGITMYRGMTATIQDTTISQNGSHGVFVEDFSEEGIKFPPDITISDCDIIGNAGRGFTHIGKGDVYSVITVSDSKFSGDADRLFSCQAAPAHILLTLERNIFQTSNSAGGIPVFAWNSQLQSQINANLVDGGLVAMTVSEGSAEIYNNTIINGNAGAFVVGNNSGNYPINIRNNIIAQSGTGILGAGGGTGFNHVNVDYNLVHIEGTGAAIDSAFTTGSHNLADPPYFVNGSTVVGAGDYHLQSISLARNYGDPAYIPATDLDSNAYNLLSPDLGAYSTYNANSAIIKWPRY